MTMSPQAWPERAASISRTLKAALEDLTKLDARQVYGMARDLAWYHLTARQRAAETAAALHAARCDAAKEPRIVDGDGAVRPRFAAATLLQATDRQAPLQSLTLEGAALLALPGVRKLQSLLLSTSRKLSVNGPEQPHVSALRDADFASPMRAHHYNDDIDASAARKTAAR